MNIDGCGFCEWCIISRWSLTTFCSLSDDDIISREVPK